MKRYTVILRNKPPKHFNGYVQALVYYHNHERTVEALWDNHEDRQIQ